MALDQEGELGKLSETFLGHSQNFAELAAKARKKGKKAIAEGYDALVKLAASDALQGAKESGQVSANGKRDGIIPTLTLGIGEK